MFSSLLTCAMFGATFFAAPVAQPAAETAAASTSVGVEITGAFTGILLDRYTQQPLRQATVALMRQDGNHH